MRLVPAILKTLGVLTLVELALPLPVTAQGASDSPSITTKGATSWSVPRTPWGDPDIQGLWPANDMQGTPYERPESFERGPR